jgi:hypothetical protein
MMELERRVAAVGRVRGVLGASARHPVMVLHVLLALRRLPLLEVTISPRHETGLSSDFSPLREPILGSRLANAVLDLAPDDEAYLVGRRKQALRTNLSHARRLSVQARRAACYEEWATAAADILRCRPGDEPWIQEIRRPRGRENMAYFIADDHEGRPIAFDVVAVLNDCSVLIWALSVPDHPSRSAARYLLHTFMRSELRSLGVRHLIGGRAGGPPGLQYFQHLLGYEVCNLRITVRDTAAAELLFAVESRPPVPVA